MSNENEKQGGNKPAYTVEEIKKMTLVERLWCIMGDSPSFKKTGYNTFGEFKYVPHDAISVGMRALLLKYRVMSLVSVVGHSRVDGLTSVDVEVVFVNIDNPDERIPVKGYGTSVMKDDKASGSAISYAIKYLYLKTMNLETHEGDTDSNSRGEEVEYEPSEMGDYLQVFFTKMDYTPERVRKVWEDNGRSWKVVEERVRKMPRSAKGKK